VAVGGGEVPHPAHPVRPAGEGTGDIYVQDYETLLHWSLAKDHDNYRRLQLIDSLKASGLAFSGRSTRPKFFEIDGKQFAVRQLQSARPAGSKLAEDMTAHESVNWKAIREETLWVPDFVEKAYRDLVKAGTLSGLEQRTFKGSVQADGHPHRTPTRVACRSDAARRAVLGLLSRIPGADPTSFQKALA